jgi:outer membrane protein assembly factor BamB
MRTGIRQVSVVVGLCALALALVLSACGGSGGTSSSTTETTETTATPPESGSTEPGAGSAEAESTPTSFTGEEPSAEWPSVGGDVGGTRYSTAEGITPENVGELKLAYAAPLDPKGTKSGSGGENNPIESEGVIYAASSSANPTVGAYEASTGKQLWQTTSLDMGISPLEKATGTRGMAVGEGLLYVEEPGGYLVGLDQKTGKLKWKTLINTQKVFQYSQPTPVYWDGLVYIGQSGSDIVGGLRGFVKAVDAQTGKVAWTFSTLPKPGTPGAKTWDSSKELTDGGGGVWTNPVIDPKLGLAYFPTGNPWPDIGGRGPGDEDYMDGVVALDMKTGKLKWFYQTTHHDEWDYDCAQPPVLWEHEIEGQQVKGLSVGCKNGYVYELNRETGEPVTPVKEEELSNAKSDPKAKAEDEKLGWVKQNGEPLTEPIPVDAGEVVPHCASKNLLPPEAPDGKGFEYACAYMYFGKDHYTAGWNGTSLDWPPSSYDPTTGYTYYCANVGIHAAKLKGFNVPQTSEIKTFPQLYANGEGEGATEPRQGWFTALNVENNKVAWQDKDKSGTECAGGSATSAGGVVFVPDSTGVLHGYDASSGKEVWSFEHESLSIDAPPIVYENEGKEYVAIAATLEGQAALLGFALGAEEPAPLTTPVKGAGAGGGEEIFTSNCGSCHTLAAAETTGQVGPNLDELKPDEKTVQTQVETGGDKMPSFKGKLSPAEIKSVATFVSKSAGK